MGGKYNDRALCHGRNYNDYDPRVRNDYNLRMREGDDPNKYDDLDAHCICFYSVRNISIDALERLSRHADAQRRPFNNKGIMQ